VNIILPLTVEQAALLERALYLAKIYAEDDEVEKLAILQVKLAAARAAAI